MNTPIPALMKQFGTEDVFRAKTAGAEPLLARLGMSILNYQLASDSQNKDNEAAQETVQKNEAAREGERERMAPARENLKHTPVPVFVEAGSRLPPGLDEGMVRLASVAASIGQEVARTKAAGIGDFISLAKSLGSKAMPALKNLGQSAAGLMKAPGAAAPAAGGLGKMLTGGLGLKTNLALGGAAIGGTLLATKAMSGVGRAMAQEPGQATYGGPVRGIGTQLPATVNQYGQPVVGAPIA